MPVLTTFQQSDTTKDTYFEKCKKEQGLGKKVMLITSITLCRDCRTLM